MKTLDQIMLSVRTDKASKYHNYTPVYEYYFKPLRHKEIVLLELGIGNIESENREGESLKGWMEYFENGSCYAIDNSLVNVGRTPRSFLCDQTDKEGLENLIKGFGNPDIIIDDASHIQKNTMKSFQILFPLLKSGGFYCIEDLQTAYFPSWGGDETIFDLSKETVMNYFFKVCHYVNLKRQETFQIPPNISVPEIYKTINSICFHHGQIIITKK